MTGPKHKYDADQRPMLVEGLMHETSPSRRLASRCVAISAQFDLQGRARRTSRIDRRSHCSFTPFSSVAELGTIASSYLVSRCRSTDLSRCEGTPKHSDDHRGRDLQPADGQRRCAGYPVDSAFEPQGQHVCPRDFRRVLRLRAGTICISADCGPA